MALHKITKGLDLPIAGEPEQAIDEGCTSTRVALVAADYVGLKPKMAVQVGDSVKRGQLLFEDKRLPSVRFTSPGAGTVSAINRGARRALQSVVIELNDNERSATPQDSDSVAFESYTGKPPESLSADEIKALLIESGLWTALRARPFGCVADPEVRPHSLFVTVIDTNPLAASVNTVIAGQEKLFEAGLRCVSKLTDGKTFVCTAPGSAVTVPPDLSNIQKEVFDGVHPAGTVGVHIHFLDPVNRDKTVWHLNYQDVLSVGKLFSTGKLDFERVVALGGPPVKKPRLLRTRLGVSLDQLLEGQLRDGENRVISGSVFSGRTASGESLGFLGRYHLQVSILQEDREREFMGWVRPGANRFSTIRAFLAGFLPKKKYDFTTSTFGSPRAIIPIGMYERVMPMDILPTFLLRSLVVGDIERAEQLGVLELDEEDLALCTFVCPGKTDYGPILRENLDEIIKEME